MSDYLPYIVSIIVALITGCTSYFAALKKCKADMKSLEISNKHEISKLMEQHKLDIDSLEHAHQLEIEKMEIEYKYQLVLKDKEVENSVGVSIVNGVLDTILKNPEVEKLIRDELQSKNQME